jgi:hypothetical protein
MGAQKIDIKKVKNNLENPRTISRIKYNQLKHSLLILPSFQEMKPMFVNTDMVVLGGNQRLKACIELGFKEVMVEIITKKYFNQVNKHRAKLNLEKKDDKKWEVLEPLTYQELCDEIVIKDNTHYGEWDWGIIRTNFDTKKVFDWGLEVPINDQIKGIEDGETIEFDKSVQIEPPQEYIIILAEPNSEEWEELKEFLKLKKVRRGGYKKGSAFDAVGLERVIKYKDFKKRIK